MLVHPIALEHREPSHPPPFLRVCPPAPMPAVSIQKSTHRPSPDLRAELWLAVLFIHLHVLLSTAHTPVSVLCGPNTPAPVSHRDSSSFIPLPREQPCRPCLLSSPDVNSSPSTFPTSDWWPVSSILFRKGTSNPSPPGYPTAWDSAQGRNPTGSGIQCPLLSPPAASPEPGHAPLPSALPEVRLAFGGAAYRPRVTAHSFRARPVCT